MKVLRPDTEELPSEAWLRQYLDDVEKVQTLDGSAPLWRSVYAGQSWYCTVMLEQHVHATRRAAPAFEAAASCLAGGEAASALGFAEEAGALHVTAARLVHEALSTRVLLESSEPPEAEWRAALLAAFEGLGSIRALPDDDEAYWRDRLAEAAAALAPFVIGYPYPEERAREAVRRVAQVVKELAAYRADAVLRPLKLAHFYPGGPARIQACLGHLECLAGEPASAVARIEALLSRPIDAVDDRLYALVVGVSAARQAGRKDLHAAWLEQIHATIDAARETYRSFEGRSYGVQEVVHQLRMAIEPRAMNGLHHTDDLLAIAEAVKARCLLDDLGGCRIAPRADPRAAPASRDATPPAAPAGDGITRDVEPAGALPDQARDERERARVSAAAAGPMGGIESGAPPNDIRFDPIREKHRASIAAREAVAAQGGYAGSVRPATPDEIRAALAPDELLVELFMPRDPFAPNKSCWIVAMHRDGIERHAVLYKIAGARQLIDGDKLVEDGPLSDLAAATRAAILDRDDAAARVHLRSLFETLIQPVLQMGFGPTRFRRWIIVPHGPLHLVPMHALLDAGGKHLIEHVTVTVAPSASVWLHAARRRLPAMTRVLAVGNPAFDGRATSLPAAEEEVLRIGDHLAWCREPLTLIGRDATEERVRSAIATAHLLHFATHGELDDESPRDGHRLLLARSQGEDGDLRAGEVRAMDLAHVGLVFLNACNGSVCRYGPGDEPLGLLAAFLSAGAINVLGGLWALDDGAAGAFALRFYDAFAHGDPAAALQAACCRAIADEVPLAHWAGMSLVGAGRRL
jgi:CHAT domain-containing protein